MPLPIAQNYGAARNMRTIVRVQNREELLVGKLVAFSGSVVNRNRPRYRDIWDMHWLTGARTDIRADLLRAKVNDRHAERAWLETSADQAGDIVGSPEFESEMKRFLPPDVAEQVLGDPMYMEFLARDTERLLRVACNALPEGRDAAGSR